MLILLILSVVIIFIIAILFSFPQFSPIPYFPSNKKDMEIIISALNLRNNQTVYDLGAGDGWVVFEAAKKTKHSSLNTIFVAVEINPVLVLILHIRRFFHPNRKNIKIIYGDMFKSDSEFKILNSKFNTMYLYVSPWFLEKILTRVKKDFIHFDIVSYMYNIPSLKGREKVIKGFNNIYLYKCVQ